MSILVFGNKFDFEQSEEKYALEHGLPTNMKILSDNKRKDIIIKVCVRNAGN